MFEKILFTVDEVQKACSMLKTRFSVRHIRRILFTNTIRNYAITSSNAFNFKLQHKRFRAVAIRRRKNPG